jgi:hypothetical protein
MDQTIQLSGEVFKGKTTDAKGRVYLGKEYANKTVKVAVEVQES